MYVCMYSMYVCMYSMYVYMYVCMYAQISKLREGMIKNYVYKCMYVFIQKTHEFCYVCMYVCMYVWQSNDTSLCEAVELMSYDRLMNTLSDHKPVKAMLNLKVKR